MIEVVREEHWSTLDSQPNTMVMFTPEYEREKLANLQLQPSEWHEYALISV